MIFGGSCHRKFSEQSERNVKTEHALGIVAGGATIVVALWFLLGRESPNSDAADGDQHELSVDGDVRKQRGSGSGVSSIDARATDSANRPRPEYTKQLYRLDEFRNLVDTNVLSLDVTSGTEWVEARVALTDPVSVFEREEDCRAKYGGFGSGRSCSYKLDVVIDKDTSGDSSVVYSRSTTDETGEYGSCGDFAKCMAGARVGSQVNLPNSAAELTALQIENRFKSNEDRQSDPAKIRQTIAVMEAMLEDVKSADLSGEDADLGYRLAMHEHLIEFWKLRLAQLEADG